jgi:hypothetical protein
VRSRNTAAGRRATPAARTEAERHAELELREAIRDAALAHGVLPRASRFVVRDAVALFERAPDGTLIGKNGASEPGNPLRPLTLHAYLLELSEDEPWLFEPRREQ